MQKGLVAILAVAVIGILGVYSKNHEKSAVATNAPTASAVASDNVVPTTGSNATQQSSNSSGYKDGTYTGSNQSTAYGDVQIAVEVSGGKITNVDFLRMPNDLGHTQEVTAVAGPILKQETLQAQSAHIDFVSGASSTSEGYQQSLQSALNKAA